MDSNSRKRIKGLGLCSGGLDSILSALILRSQGIDVAWVSFVTPFFSSEKAEKAAKEHHIPLIIKNITPVYMEMLKHPVMGYGKNMNPCTDCHTLMFRLAGHLMKEEGVDFLYSGEVMGQRPKSQTRSALRYVEKHSGFDGYILRPLSAKLLPETIPEREGWVNRELLFDFSGRSRKPQMALAEKIGVTRYPAPAGGCLLTDINYSIRLKDLLAHQGDPDENTLHLLGHGRHFRIRNGAKIIVGRMQRDNENLQKYYTPGRDTLIKAEGVPGPIVLVQQGSDDESIRFAASLCVGYGKTPDGTAVDVRVVSPAETKTIRVLGIPPATCKELMI